MGAPVNVVAPFDPAAISVTASSGERTASTAGTTVATAGASYARIDGIHFKAQGSTSQACMLVFYYDGTNRTCIGEVQIEEVIVPTAQTPSWEKTWRPPQPFLIPASDTIQCIRTAGSGNFVAIPLGGQLA